MYNFKKYRTIVIILLITLIVCTIALSSFIWNILLKTDQLKNIFFIITFLSLIFGAFIWLFLIGYTLTDRTRFDKYLEGIRNNEKSKLIDELEKNKNEENIEVVEQIDIQEIYDRIVPDVKKVKTLDAFADKLLINLAKELEIVQGLCFTQNKGIFGLTAKYAFAGEHIPEEFKPGETLPGQAASNKEVTIISEIPESYFKVESGLGASLPKYLAFVPLVNDKKTLAVLELAGFKKFDNNKVQLLNLIKNGMAEHLAKFIKK